MKIYFSVKKYLQFVFFYGRFEDIGVLHVMSVFYWLYKFDLDVQLGIDVNIHLVLNYFAIQKLAFLILIGFSDVEVQ